MTTLYVQFTDDTNTKIVAMFSGPQDPTVYPNQGTVDTSDARYATFYEAQPVALPCFPVPTTTS